MEGSSRMEGKKARRRTDELGGLRKGEGVWRFGLGQEAWEEGVQSRKGGRMGGKIMPAVSSWGWVAVKEWRWKQWDWRYSWSWEVFPFSGSFLVQAPVAQGEDLCLSVWPPFFGGPCDFRGTHPPQGWVRKPDSPRRERFTFWPQ